MSETPSQQALLIAGATASGKSAVAMELGQRFDAVIINADALQVYAELKVLTARPAIEDERRVPHRLYGYVSGKAEFSAATWLADVENELTSAWARNRLPIVVGGTGLYFRLLQKGLADIPPIPLEIRNRWRAFGGDLAKELNRRDPESKALNLPADRQRLIRALEVIEATGKPLRYWQRAGETSSPLRTSATVALFLDVPREILYARAAARFDEMLREGAIDEVRPLLSLDPALPMMRAIGVREITDYLLGRLPLDEATEAAKTATRHYIKRQQTWWRHQMPGWDRLPASETAAQLQFTLSRLEKAGWHTTIK
jgi:tRNA dimethylallyltransferase